MFAPFGYKPPMDEMDKLVELLKAKKFSSEAEVEAYLKASREKKREKEPNKMVFNDLAASIIYPNGFVVTFGKQGSINWAYDGKKVEDDTATPLIDSSDLQQCLEHLVGLHLKDYQMIRSFAQQCQDKIGEGRTRYVKNDTKRAFVAGMIHGKKNPNS